MVTIVATVVSIVFHIFFLLFHENAASNRMTPESILENVFQIESINANFLNLGSELPPPDNLNWQIKAI